MNAFDPQNPGIDFFKPSFTLARIETSATISGENYRWLYTVQPLQISSAALDTAPGFTNRGGTAKAINVTELANTSTNASGFDPSNIPSGFTVRPASGLVLCFPTNAKIGSTVEPVFLFNFPNPIDGTCA